jgi:hypothetical protein
VFLRGIAIFMDIITTLADSTGAAVPVSSASSVSGDDA